jgi:hypothetical protein
MVGVEAVDEMRGHGGRGRGGDGEVVKVMLADVSLSCLVFLHHHVYVLCLNFLVYSPSRATVTVHQSTEPPMENKCAFRLPLLGFYLLRFLFLCLQ